MKISKNDPRHGTANGYQAGCRCDPCREGGKEYIREWHAGRLEDMRPEDHGKVKFYQYGCRCDKCKKAHRDSLEDRKVKRQQARRANPGVKPLNLDSLA